MSEQPADEAREQRIQMEIVVDAYDAEEQASGWYNYLDDTLHFPFRARCIAERAISPVGRRFAAGAVTPIQSHARSWRSSSPAVP